MCIRDSPQTDNSNSGMYDDGSSEQKASKYNFYVQLTGTGDMLLGQHVYVAVSYTHLDVYKRQISKSVIGNSSKAHTVVNAEGWN